MGMVEISASGAEIRQRAVAPPARMESTKNSFLKTSYGHEGETGCGRMSANGGILA
jgi:hypothetical protein